MASEEDNGNAAGNGETVTVKKETSSSSDSERDKALNSSQITNSEDAKMVKARIFVGNLPADLRTEKGELYDKFIKHGRILGVSIHNRFAFVQFETEEDAKSAVKAENHSEFRSARLELKMAIEGRQNRDNNRDKRPRSRSPMDRRDRDRDRDSRDRRRDSRDRRADSRDRYSRNRSPPPYVPSAVEDRFCHPRTFGANDVEIIVIRKQQGQYAEGILKRLSDRKLSANMLFLSETAPLEGAVAEFGRCGTHYVITVMPRHEETRAITINMFEGNDVPKIYRNINVDDGCDVIAGHFRDHFPALLRLRQAEAQGPHFYPQAPAEVVRTLNRVAELCAVPTSSLDATLRYLQEMRDRTAQWEGLSTSSSMSMPGQNAYRGADMDTGKAYGMTDMTGGRSSNGVGAGAVLGADAAAGDSIRESLLGLLKATSFSMNGAANVGVGLAGAYPGAPAAGAYGGYGAAGSQAVAAGLSADPIIQKALASLVGTGLLNQAPTGPSPTQTPQTQNSQNTQSNNIPASYRSSSTSQVADENGGGGYSSQSAGGRSSDYSSASAGGRSADYGSQSVGGRSADYSNQSVGGRSVDNGYNTQGGGGGADGSGGYGGGQSGVTGGRASYGTAGGGAVGYGGQQAGGYGSAGSGGGGNQVNTAYGGGGTGQAGSAYGSGGGQATGGYSSQQSGGYGVGGGQNITRTIAGTNADRAPQPAAYAGMNATVGGYQQQQQQQGQQGQTGLQRGQPAGAYAARR